MDKLGYIKGISYAVFIGAGKITSNDSKESLRLAKERTNANSITLVPNVLQDTPQSETIDFSSPATMTDDEIKETIDYIHSLGMTTILKPTVNCKNGTWRAHISFFEKDVPCEPKWSNWFNSYTKMQLHFAKLAEETGCEMFIPGCEMVMSEHREMEWRNVIKAIRSEYSGLISYNTDKYQEGNINWWDEVDVISSSGYYPIDKWDSELDRIEKVVKKFNKPFFFAEAGCMSAKGSKMVPNNWCVSNESDLQGQKDWYQAMFEAISKRDWVEGVSIWDWKERLYKPDSIENAVNYQIYAKPAEAVVKEYFTKL